MKKARRAMAQWFLVFTVVAGSWAFSSAEAAAEETMGSSEFDEEIASLETGPIVRRQLLHRSARLEIQPMMAFSLNDAFIRNGLPGVSISYYLNNLFGIGATANFGALQMDTSLRRNLEATLDDGRLGGISYSKFQWTMDAGLIYVPAFGKFSVMDSFFAHYDFHLMGGMAMIGESVEPALAGTEGDPGLSGVRPGGMFGAGMRFFLGDMISLNLQMRNYVAARAEVSSGAASTQLGNTVILSAGIGIFLPGEVKISR